MPDNIDNLGGVIDGPKYIPNQRSIPSSPTTANRPLSFDELFEQGTNIRPSAIETIPLSSIYQGNRYASSRPGEDLEEMYAQQQSVPSKWMNAAVKMAGTFSASYLGGTAGLVYGAVEALTTGRLAAIADNEVNRKADAVNKYLEDAAPNYYKHVEQDADWYSPDNLLTANFWSDKVMKNLAYSYGAIAGGMAWAKILKSIALGNNLVQAGRGMETATAIEKAVAAVPNAEKYTAFNEALTSTAQKYFVNPFAQNVLKNAERITIGTTGALGEGSIESLQNLNDFRKNAIEGFRLKYGRNPQGAELDEINSYADQVGNYTLGANFLLLSATNYLQLPKILGSSKRVDKAMINDVSQNGVLGGAWSSMIPKSAAMRNFKRTANVLGLGFSPSEAFEETAQYAIQTGVNGFFNKAYRNKDDISSFWSNLASATNNIFGEGIDRALTDKEGLESLLIGGISGGIQQARGEVKKRGFTGEGGFMAANTDVAITALNTTNIQEQLLDQAKFVSIGIGSQRARQNAIVANDVLEEKDAEHDFVLSYVMPRAKYGKVDSITAELDLYARQAATQAGHDELINSGFASPNETKEAFIGRIENLKAIAKSVNDTYDAINDRYSDEINDLGERKYSRSVIDKLVYAVSKIDNYDQRIPGVNNALINAGINTSEILESIIKSRYDNTPTKSNKEATQEALKQINDLDVVSTTKDKLKESLSDVMEMSLRRQQLINEYNKIINTPEAYDDMLPTTIDLVEQPNASVEQLEVPEGKKRKKVVTKDLEIGREYSLSDSFRREGNQLQLAPKLTVLSTTLGGEYEVKLPNGDVVFLSPEQFKKYELTEDDNTDDQLEEIMNKAIENVLSKKEYIDAQATVSDENVRPIDIINGLDKKNISDDVEKEFKKLSSEYFKDVAEQEKEMEKVTKNEEQVETLLDSEDEDPQSDWDIDGYDPVAKKSDLVIPNAGVASKKIPGYLAANLFGSKFYTFPNREKIRAILVTQKTEEALKLPGLMKHLQNKREDVDPENTIAMVMVEVDNGKAYLLNKYGERIEGTATVDNTVYQVMPTEKLQWSEEFDSASMFRKETAQTAAIRAEYAKFRTEILAETNLIPYEISASFGNPDKLEKGKTVSAEEAGLITSSELNRFPLLKVPTTENTIKEGYTTYNNASGKVFLVRPNGTLPLSSNKLTKATAETVYNAVVRLSELMIEGDLNGKDGTALMDWLRTVVYWGTPVTQDEELKDPGMNSVFFRATDSNLGRKLELVVSNKGDVFPFTPRGLEKNKIAIMELLEGMRHNVKASVVNKEWNKKYLQVVAVNPNGSLKTKTWKNYQTYLLSSEDREPGAVPLQTDLKPIAGPDQTNKEGVYFILKNNAQRYLDAIKTVSVPSKITPGAPKKATASEAAPTSQEAPTQAPQKGKAALIGEFNPSGRNRIETPYGIISFTIKPGEMTPESIEINPNISVTNEQALNSILDSLAVNYPDATLGDAISSAQQAIFNTIKDIGSPEANEAIDEAFDNAFPSTEEEVSTTEVPTTTSEAKVDLDDILNDANIDDEIAPFRVAIEETIKDSLPEDWNKIEEFVKANFPKIPVARVMNMLKTASGRRAFGMYKTGMVYLYQNAEVGTVYHEIFHAVWEMFTTPEERAIITKQIRSRKGTFVDRETGIEYKYNDPSVTSKQIEELMAEEARDYFQNGKVPVKPESGRPWFVNFLSDLVKIIKEFFLGKGSEFNLEELFKRMGSGYYKNYASTAPAYTFYNNAGILEIDDLGVLADDANFRVVPFTGQEQHDAIEHMVFSTLQAIVDSDEGLYRLGKIGVAELLDTLHKEVQKRILFKAKIAKDLVTSGKYKKEQVAPIIEGAITRWKDIRDPENWKAITQQYEDRLKSFDITFDEENLYINNDENKSGKEDYIDSRKINNLKDTSGAVKLLLATLPMHDEKTKKPLLSRNINGVKLLPLSEAYMTIMNRTHASRNIDEMMQAIKQLAQDDINYARVFTRLLPGADINSESIDYSGIKKQHQVKLINSFWKAFKKQNPDVKNVYFLDNGDVVVGESNFTSAAQQLREKYENKIKDLVKKPNPYFKYNESEGAWYGLTEDKKDLSGYKKDIDTMVEFLSTLNIEFDASEVKLLDDVNRRLFETATSGLIDSISSKTNAKKIVTVNGKVLNIRGRLLELAQVQAKIDNPEFNSTYYNVNGERVQVFIGTNLVSDLYDELSQIKNKKELVDTQFSYILTDPFSQYSTLLDAMFDPETGDRLPETDNLMKVGYADGIVDKVNRKQKEASKLSYKDRLIQELNLNLKGYYSNLIPGDASIEWLVYMGNRVNNLNASWDEVNEIFRGYFISEMNLSRKKREIVVPEGSGRKNTDLRFFKSIFRNAQAKNPNETHDKFVKMKGDPAKIYEANKEEIDLYVKRYIVGQSNLLLETLTDYNVITSSEEKTMWKTDQVAFSSNDSMSNDTLNNNLQQVTANYIINNIELHKLIYSDPYQYEDELKRIKSFNSPRQPLLHGSLGLNAIMSAIYNKDREAGDIGYTDFDKDGLTSITLSDVMTNRDTLKGYEKAFKETDGAGLILFPAYRQMRIRSDNWNEDEENQFVYDIAFEKKKKNKPLNAAEIIVYSKGNPKVRSAYTTIKPIVTGNKGNGQSFNDVVLDKFALTPISYRILDELSPKEESNMMKLYNKMQDESIDYAVFKSSRKVGGNIVNEPYDKEGGFNTTPYNGKVEIPFSIMSIQTEVPSKDDEEVTRGSQVTKLITMDFLEAGVPVDYMPGKDINVRRKAWNAITSDVKKEEASPIYKEIRNNQELLQAITEEGYQQLLREMGMKENKDGTYTINDTTKIRETLRQEMLKREVNVNIIKALDNFLKGHTVIEATPAYQQVRNILYSIADRNVISPKITGGQKVQISSTFLESIRGRQNDRGAYESDILKFYTDEDGKRVCEVMVSRWFDSDMSDEDLLNYLNDKDHPERLKMLSGVGFRIPTQKQNSIDRFVIKQFLPYEYGDNVVIPSALVQKTGSDFDIDKLFIYLKNIYVSNGEFKLIPFVGYGEQAKAELRKLITDATEEKVNRMYKQSLQNAYIESSENLVSNKYNFSQLIKPNSADQLKQLAKDVTSYRGLTQFDYSNVGNLMNRVFMTKLRNAFVSGKYAIGIAAVNQTSHSLNQRQPTFVDTRKLDSMTTEDKFWLGDAKINFNQYNKINIDGNEFASLSGIKSANLKDFISDVLGQFIDGYVDISKGPWIMELGATPNVASTWMFLVKIGVPIDTVSYFMNQPIIRDYLKSLDSAGYTWLFNTQILEQVENRYPLDKRIYDSIQSIPSDSELIENIAKKSFTKTDSANQRYILTEFLKYAKLAEHSFKVTQGSNFDTANFNDPFLIFRKEEQLKAARNTMISSVDDILSNSYIGFLGNRIGKVGKMYATVLTSGQKNVAQVIENVLRPYVNMSEREFTKLSQKVVADLFDWSLQVANKTLPADLRRILLNDTRNTAAQMNAFITNVKADTSHPMHYNQVVKIMSPLFSDKMGNDTTNNLTLDNKDNKVYDQNQIIYAFQELKDYFISQGKPYMYDDIVRLAILQSGISNSPISFTSLLPYDDFVNQYGETLSTLGKLTDVNLNDFYDLGVFQRNNWSNDDIIPSRKPKYKIDKRTGSGYYDTGFVFADYAEAQTKLNDFSTPKLYRIDTRAFGTRSNYLVYTWEEVPQGKNKSQMKKEGDFSYIKRGLFQKVYETPTEPLIITGPAKNEQYVYKMINAWGDSFRANEFYDSIRPSIIDNGFEKLTGYKKIVSGKIIEASPAEVSDSEVVQLFKKGVPLDKQTAPTETNVGGEGMDATVPVPDKPSSITVVERYTDADVKANPNTIYVFGDNTKRTGTGGQAQIRNNPNAMGIATKLAPSMEESAFMTDADLDNNKAVIDSDIAKIKATGNPVVLPKDGFGTGLAKLKEKAPQTYSYLKQRLLEEFGFNNDNGTISQQLSNENMVTPSGKWKLDDGQSYSTDEINTALLKSIGYSKKRAAEVIKSICKPSIN